jgi:predicted nucleotidyltransferase
MAALGSGAHRAIIKRVTAHYQDDARVLAVAVFGSVSAGAWHELSDVDLDIVTSDDAAISPAEEAVALFGPAAVLVLAHPDSADIVLDSLEEVSIRWHPLRTTSPNITATARVVHGSLADAELAAAGEANRARPDESRLLDALVRDAIGAAKYLARDRRWETVAAIERMRRSLLELRGRRDTLQLDPADPGRALAALLDETQASYDLGPARRALLNRIGPNGLAPPAAPRQERAQP